MAVVRRRIEPLSDASLRDLLPKEIDTDKPETRWVAPTDLLVDEAYQRSLGEKSNRMIRRIVANWSWHKFKPPICAEVPEGLEVIDGQHTAIAAASHPEIDLIPVFIVGAANVTERADSFLGHNRDRLNLTPQQIHHGAVAAQDPVAVEVDKVCKSVGITVLKSPAYEYKVGDTLAIGTLTALVRRRGHVGAARVLSILVGAQCRPVTAGQIQAVDSLLFDPQYMNGVTVSSLIEAIHLMGATAERDAKIFAATHKVPIWRGLAVTYFRRASGRRSRSTAQEYRGDEVNYPFGEVTADDACEFLRKYAKATVQTINGSIYVNGDRHNLAQLTMRVNRILERNNQPGITVKPVHEVRKA